MDVGGKSPHVARNELFGDTPGRGGPFISAHGQSIDELLRIRDELAHELRSRLPSKQPDALPGPHRHEARIATLRGFLPEFPRDGVLSRVRAKWVIAAMSAATPRSLQLPPMNRRCFDLAIGSPSVY